MSDTTTANGTIVQALETISGATILRELFDRADTGMSLADVNTRRFLRVNAKLCEITGYSQKELVNTSADALTHPDDRAADRESFERFTRGEIDRRVVEKRYIRRDGTSVWVHITTTIVELDNVRCSFGITEDISERKAALAALEAAERRKNHFLAMLAHELRNPLAAIRNSSEVLRALPYEDRHFQRVTNIIERQSHNLERLVDDLLDSARITTGKVTLHNNYIRLAQIVDEAVETVQHHLRVRNHELSISLPPHEVTIYGDKLRLVQAFGNLLTNAIKYTPDKGRIDIEARIDAGDVVVAVTDSGIGISPEELPHIFKLFEQAERGSERTDGGLGIGLSITKRLVELHDGDIQVRSHQGLGSTFKVRLPCADRRTQAAVVRPAAIQANASILVVEDNADVAETLAMVLSSSGHEVRIAPDGANALNIVGAWPPEICLIDIGLPDIEGCDLVRRLRALEATKNAFMVAISGYGQQHDIDRSLQAGFDQHLVKPVNFETLVAILSTDRRGQARGHASG